MLQASSNNIYKLMEGLLDWVGGPPRQRRTTFFSPPVPPRAYSITAADAVMQGRDALPAVRDAASMADIQRQQYLAPLQAEAERQKLEGQIDLQPKILDSRDELVQALAGLDPTHEDYLKMRRDAVMKNPYGLSDPTAQEILRTNDRAYDDYIQGKRLEASLTPRELSPPQIASLYNSISKVAEEIANKRLLDEDVTHLEKQLEVLNNLVEGRGGAATPATPEATPSPAAASPTTSFKTDEEAWQSSKEKLLSAIIAEAEKEGVNPTDIMTQISKGDVLTDDFFTRYVGGTPESKAFTVKKPRYGSDDVSWEQIFMALQGDQNLLNSIGTTPRKRAGLGPPPTRTLDNPVLGTPGQGWEFTQIK